jgi:hypothetical protein
MSRSSVDVADLLFEAAVSIEISIQNMSNGKIRPFRAIPVLRRIGRHV